MPHPTDGTPRRCDVCAKPATFVGRYFGRRTHVCDGCRTTFECSKCEEVPGIGGKCRCSGGRPTLPAWEPVATSTPKERTAQKPAAKDGTPPCAICGAPAVDSAT